MSEQPDNHSLNGEPLATEPKSHRVRATYFEGQISFKEFRGANPHFPVLASEPLVIEPVKGCHASLTKFGAVIFWNCTDQVEREILDAIRAQPSSKGQCVEVEDELDVHSGRDRDNVSFDGIELQSLSVEEVKIISLALGQSVALEHFELEVADALKRSEPTVSSLRQHGWLNLSQRRILKTVGFALNVRAEVLANLTLFDSPPETWESESLAKLHSQLLDHFDIAERHGAINRKVDYLTDLNATLMDLLQNQKSHHLEWMIILLILIEIIFLVYVEL